MTDIQRTVLLTEIENLNQIIECPQLYLINYFNDLRYLVDKEIVSKQIKLKEDEIGKKKRLNEIWQVLIKKIYSLEKKFICNKIKDVHSIKTELNDLEAFANHAKDLDYLEEKIKQTEGKILMELFENKTILYLKPELNINKRYLFYNDHLNSAYGKLVIFDDVFIRKNAIER